MIRRKVNVFVMVSELLQRADEKRNETEKDCLRFWRDGHKMNCISLHFPHP